MIESCNHSDATLCHYCKTENRKTKELDQLRQENTELKERVEELKFMDRFVGDTRPPLLHFRWAPGNYSNKCQDCGDIFTGDKLAGRCADCAYQKEADRTEAAEAKVKDLETQLANYKQRTEVAEAKLKLVDYHSKEMKLALGKISF